MLPGVRFLFAAILISTSLLVFALGAAALLRATHEQFVSNPSWRSGPQEQVFAQASEPVRPVLAALRVEPMASGAEPSVRDQIPTIALPVTDAAPEQTAALAPEAALPAVEARASEPAPPEATTSSPTDEPTTPETTGQVSESKGSERKDSEPNGSEAKAEESKVTAETAPAASSAATSEPAQLEAPASTLSEADMAVARMAALNAPSVTAEQEPAANIKVDSGATEKKATKRRAHRAKKRRIVLRPPPPAQVQQTFDPFGRQPMATASTMRTR
ncbi:hypothetical protein [Bradyrhizobium liaoningense]|uniref:hypothetical protein n=1 Tax=Bradyrhizobium liaoningense TaxID=43992 RepID=UPI001BACDA0B|nr:hypothetical protein [Bradyrhizobium liaoningense]MBR0714882.1 hypothetical protein [Bradyrhizobium liaoningense]